MKDGKIIEVQILCKTENEMLIKHPNGKKKTISRKKVLRILDKDLDRDKIYIYKKDGKILKGFIVSEDSKSLIFRKKLYSPQEIRIRKREVDKILIEKKPAWKYSSFFFHKSPGDDTGRARRFLLSIYGAYAMPRLYFKNSLKPSPYFAFSGEYAFSYAGPFVVSGFGGGNYISLKRKSSVVNGIDFQVLGFWGGLSLGYPFSWHKKLSFHAGIAYGYAVSVLTGPDTNSRNESGDPCWMGMFEIRYRLFNRFSLFYNASYLQVVYTGPALSNLTNGLGIGIYF